VLATRVVSQGDDTSPKVCDGGMLPIPPAHRDALVEFIRGELAAMRDQEPEVDEVVRQRALFKSLVGSGGEGGIAGEDPGELRDAVGVAGDEGVCLIPDVSGEHGADLPAEVGADLFGENDGL
jgi:hypothetical protein